MLISAKQLKAFAHGCDAALIAPHLDAAAARFGIDTPREIRHFMAHLHCESAGFTRIVENMNYSAKRLCQVWPSRFPTLAAAAPYANNPQKLANKVYGGRLGNTGPNDGWLFRGSGPIQTTGKFNFIQAGKWCGVDFVADPDKLRTWEYGSIAAAGFWSVNGLNGIVAPDKDEKVYASLSLAVKLNEEDDLVQGRLKVNGGRHGLDAVRTALLRAAPIWGA